MTNLQDLLVQWTIIVLMEPSTKIILTVAHKYFVANSGRLEPNRVLKTRHFRSRVGVANVKVGVAKKFRARFVRVLYSQNPPLQNPKSATESVIIGFWRVVRFPNYFQENTDESGALIALNKVWDGMDS